MRGSAVGPGAGAIVAGIFAQPARAMGARRAASTVDGRAVLPRQKVWGGEVIDVTPAARPRGGRASARKTFRSTSCSRTTRCSSSTSRRGWSCIPAAATGSGTLLNALLRARARRSPACRAPASCTASTRTPAACWWSRRRSPRRPSLVRQLQARSVKREYLAVVHGRVARDGRIEAPIGRHPVKRTRMAVVARGRPAVTHYQVLERYRGRDAAALPARNRAHPPDPRAPERARPPAGRRPGLRQAQQQHSVSAPGAARGAARRCVHPANRRKRLSWHADPPADMQELIESLRERSAQCTGHVTRQSAVAT